MDISHPVTRGRIVLITIRKKQVPFTKHSPRVNFKASFRAQFAVVRSTGIIHQRLSSTHTSSLSVPWRVRYIQYIPGYIPGRYVGT